MNKIQSSLDGMLNILANTNLGNSVLANRQILKSADPGPIENPLFYVSGFLSGLTVELSTLTLSVYQASVNTDCKYLFLYTGLKFATLFPNRFNKNKPFVS